MPETIDINALAAGPELDALVAERVMRWKRPHSITYREADRRDGGRGSCFRTFAPGGNWWADVDWRDVELHRLHDKPVEWRTWEFSEELDYAALLSAHLRSLGWIVEAREFPAGEWLEGMTLWDGGEAIQGGQVWVTLYSSAGLRARGERRYSVQGVGETLPLALCRAAVRMVMEGSR